MIIILDLKGISLWHVTCKQWKALEKERLND